ncbi:thrombospondin-1-like [Lingula anatina]|uniref:Thrombospondin-1-like n=1 Tax=Lingula anatina TaxID=7574 RepID=A0A2R2MU00_LINAN|nr:thrombospondin-1-like [Lingula anatina]|eukprot:XP_023933618.1 thrombospondin-1-like [Lingula anatina]
MLYTDIPDVNNFIGWSLWGSWTACSKSCDSGIQTRSRTCGRGNCEGDTSQSRPCNTRCCNPLKAPLRAFDCTRDPLLCLSCQAKTYISIDHVCRYPSCSSFPAACQYPPRYTLACKPDPSLASIEQRVRNLCQGKTTCNIQMPCGGAWLKSYAVKYSCCCAPVAKVAKQPDVMNIVYKP